MASPVHLSGIEVFLRSVKSGSFTAAARDLGVTKSAVAKSVAQLEERLDVKLLHRTTRRLMLTAEGAAFFEQCNAAVEQIRDAEIAARSRAGSLRGILRVDMPAAFGRAVALPVLLDILRRHPDLRLSASFSDRLIDPIEDGVDLCIRFGNPPDRLDVAARKLGEQSLLVCAAPSYIDRAGAPVTVPQLRDHACIVGSREGRHARWHFRDDQGRPMEFDPPATHLCGDGDAVIKMALSGFGFCQMPESLVRGHVATGGLVPVLSGASSGTTPVCVIWPLRRQMLPRVRLVVDELAARAERGEF